jgi:hypothetical protein
MRKDVIFGMTGLVLFTTFALPLAAIAATDKSTEKNIATDTTAKKAQLLSESKTGMAGPNGVKGEAGTSSTEVRNWAAIDTNKDHSIQPEEMEKYLTESWAAQKKAATKAK